MRHSGDGPLGAQASEWVDDVDTVGDGLNEARRHELESGRRTWPRYWRTIT